VDTTGAGAGAAVDAVVAGWEEDGREDPEGGRLLAVDTGAAAAFVGFRIASITMAGTPALLSRITSAEDRLKSVFEERI
jgi:hypothetical protein